MNTKLRDLSKVLQDIHADKWVALSPDYTNIVAYSASLMDLQKTVGGKDVVYIKAPSEGTIFAFFC